MLYIDTSVLVALCTHEAKTAQVQKWYAVCTDEIASAAWCVTEFGSALGIKQRTAQLTPGQANVASAQFERICANDLKLLPLEPSHFHHAATLCKDFSAALRAGDALHLACAIHARATGLITLDSVMAKNAKRLKLKPMTL